MQLVLLTVLHKRCWGVSLEETWAASGDQKRKYTTSFNSRGLCQGWQVHCAKRNSNGLKALQAAKLQWKYCSIWTVLWVLKHEIQRWQILMLRSMDEKLHWEKHWIPRSSNTSSLIPRPLFAKKNGLGMGLQFIEYLCDNGIAISIAHVQAAAEGYLLSHCLLPVCC